MGTASAAGAAQEAVAGAARNRTYPGARRSGPKSYPFRPWARQMPPRSRAISTCATSGEISQA